MVASVSTTVGATFEIDDGDLLAVGLGGVVGRLDRQRVGGGGLEVEVVGVVDGDRAGARVDGEGQAVVAVPVGVAAGDGPHVGDVVVAGGRDGHDRCVGGGCLVDGRLGVGDGDGDVRDRDRDVLAVVVDVVGRLDRQRVAGRGLEVEVVGVVDGDRAGVGVDGERQAVVVVPVGVAAGDGPGEAVVVAGGRDGDHGGVRGGRLSDGGVGVDDGRSDVRDRDGDVLAVGGDVVVRLDRQRVAGGGLEVEVVGVVDGDRAGVGVDGEGQAVVAVPVGVAAGDGPGEAVVVAGGRDGDHGGVRGGGLGDGGVGVDDGRSDVRDRDGDVLAVGVDVVGRLDRQRVVVVVSKSRSSASLTVIAPVSASMAKGRLLSPSPSVLPPVMDQVRPSSSPVVVTVTTAVSAAAVSEMVASVSTTVGATFEIVMVMSSVSVWVAPSVAWTVSV